MGGPGRALLRVGFVLGLGVAGLSVTAGPSSADASQLSLVSVGSSGTTGSESAFFGGATPDGSHVYFTTTNSLVPADTDGGGQDLYERAGGVTTLVSTGPTDAQNSSDGSGFGGVSADGSRVFFWSGAQLTADDTDNAQDVYERAGGVTTLVSLGTQSNESNPNLSAFFAGASTDGSRVVFTTSDQLLPADTDALPDVYVRANGTTTLVSPGGLSSFAFPDRVRVSADGTRISFDTSDSLLPADTDAFTDVYVWDPTGLHLVSREVTGGNGNISALSEQMSSTGAVLFSTKREAADTDISRDYYVAAPGQPLALVTASGSEAIGVASAAISDDGQHVVYITEHVGSGPVGVHRYDGGQYTAVPLSGPATTSNPEVRHVSPNGSRALIQGSAQLYRRRHGRRRGRLPAHRTRSPCSTPAGPGDASAYRWAMDLRRVVYGTESRVFPSDTDDWDDTLDAVAGGQTTLVTADTPLDDAVVAGMSADGRVMWVEAIDALTAADTNTDWDVYEVAMLAPTSTGVPSVGGTPAPGQTLTCLPGSWSASPGSYSFQWKRDGAPIGGATAATYVVQAGDAGHSLSCTVTATNTDGSASATSAAVVVPAAGPTTPTPVPVLKPGPCANVQSGTGKADQLTGTTAGDKLVGRGGADLLRGLGQADCLVGGGGKDKLKGGPGNDKLVGGPKQDTLLGGGGKDVIRSRDGVVDVVKCGGGRDKVVGDKADKLVGCEVRKLT